MTISIKDWNGLDVNLKSNTENGEEKSVHDIDNFPLTAFWELAMAEATPKVQVQFPYNLNTRIVDINATWSGFTSQGNSLAILSTGSTAWSTIQLCTKRVLKYNTGQWGLVRFTYVFPTMTDISQYSYIGYWDNSDWYQFWYKGTQFWIFRHQWGVENFIPQGSFNWALPAGFNPQLGNVYQIKFQWLGFGWIQFFIEDASTGQFTKVHEIKYANSEVSPSIYNPSLPICIYATNGTTTDNLSWATASLYGAIEWKEEELGEDNAAKWTGASGTNVNLLTIRNKSTFQSKTNRVRLKLALLSIANDGNQIVSFDIYKNQTITSPTYTDRDTNTSVVEFDTAWTIWAIDWIFLTSAQIAKDGSDKFFLQDLDIKVNPGETITIVSNWPSTASTASLTWKELF